jgi:uncharacterized protein (UPF0218 family)
MTKTEEIRQTLEREVATLHQTIGGLMVRIESLEKQKECLVKVGAETSANLNVLKDKFYAQLEEAGLIA